MSHILRSPRLCQQKIDNDSTWASTPLPSFSNELPLHQSILNDSPFACTQLIFRAYPDGVLHQDDGGNTPLHCACAMGDRDVVALLLEQVGCNPTCRNNEEETPLDILNSVTTHKIQGDQDDRQQITLLLEQRKYEQRVRDERQARRHNREQLWNMSENEGWFYAAIHGSIPLRSTPEMIQMGLDTEGLQVSGVKVMSDLCNEDDFNMHQSTAQENNDRSAPEHKGARTALELACLHLNPGIVHTLLQALNVKEQRQQVKAAIGIVEGIITSVVVDNELSTLSMHQSEHIRAPPSGGGRTRNKFMKKNGRMKKIKAGESKNDQNLGKKRAWQAGSSDTEKLSLNDATDILRMLTKGKHALFEEDRLRRQQWMKELPRDTENELANGIDVIIRDPMEYEKMLKRMALKQQQRKKKNMDRAKKMVDNRIKRKAKMKEKEIKRRAKNAAMLVEGGAGAYDKQKKKYWFQSGWTSERFAVLDIESNYDEYDSEEEEEEDGVEGGGGGSTCCCSMQ